MRQFLVLGLVAILSVSAAHAQDKPASAESDYPKRLELAKRMNDIRPAKTQVQEAVSQVGQNLSPVDRDKFNKMVEKAFDYEKLEKLSVETMAELFTVPELEKMVDYFGSPEAKAIAEKLPKYQEKVQPAIIQMLDAAMIADRTGGAAAPKPAAKAAEKPASSPAAEKTHEAEKPDEKPAEEPKKP